MNLTHWSDQLTAIVVICTTLFGVYRWALAKVVRPVQKIFDELTPNGGSSIKDQITEIRVRQDSLLATMLAITEANEAGVWVSDVDGKCVSANTALSELMGNPPASILGDGWRACIAQDDRARVEDEWDAAVAQKRQFRLSYCFVGGHGEKLGPFDVRGVPVRDAGSKVVGFVGIVKSIEK